MNFASDNTTGGHPAILRALIDGNAEPAMPYGADSITERVENMLRTVFDKPDLRAFMVATGSAANSLALAALTPPYGAVICHRTAHIEEDECGCPELFTGGAKLRLVDGPHGKMAPADVEKAARWGKGDVHAAQSASCSITNLTERGTAYNPDEVAAIAHVCRETDVKLHMDGARFANALVGLGCTPAELTWKAGVDVLSFGATKNGALAAEAVIFFDPGLAFDFELRRKRAGHLFSKMRTISLQMEAYLTDDLWLANARHSNAMAARLADGLRSIPAVRLETPVDGNEIFPHLPVAAIKALRDKRFIFYDRAEDEAVSIIRLVTAFNTKTEDVDAFIESAKTAVIDNQNTFRV